MSHQRAANLVQGLHDPAAAKAASAALRLHVALACFSHVTSTLFMYQAEGRVWNRDEVILAAKNSLYAADLFIGVAALSPLAIADEIEAAAAAAAASKDV